ncbi:hypothetical protein [Saccharibacillus kuerlensis]|uniref:Uncharacterized protein n=1 Tax=Saccharibacillus kuerlensis TaxID=459527 RepID=A0ABQ2KQ14_9BACL|nr:hypothetical protein [Saccharibacillus kuerlensis]GGN90015.1 hypothetical protein GCM10010969_00060 [Saccharibacillus kuerlensis]
MFLKKSCTCIHCFRTFECTGAFGPDGARYITGAVAWMKLLVKEPDRLLLEGSTFCTACTEPNRFLVEYDCVNDRYIDIGEAAEEAAIPVSTSYRTEPYYSTAGFSR